MRTIARRSIGIGGFAAVLLLVGGCASGPGELQRLRVENELLREQIRVVRANCSYYRDVEMEVDDEGAAAGE